VHPRSSADTRTTVTDSPIVLASASSRRRELLAQIGVPCVVRPAQIDESPLPGEHADGYVLRVARAKALAVASAMGADTTVLGADTAVVVDGELLGKPRGPDDARGMLRRLSGRTHEVVSAVVVIRGQREASRVVVSRVTMRPLGEDEIARYCATDEPYDKAGGYAVQGRAAAFITHLEGSYTGVVGLPLFETADLLSEVRE
jgi:septum formation protein